MGRDTMADPPTASQPWFGLLLEQSRIIGGVHCLLSPSPSHRDGQKCSGPYQGAELSLPGRVSSHHGCYGSRPGRFYSTDAVLWLLFIFMVHWIKAPNLLHSSPMSTIIRQLLIGGWIRKSAASYHWKSPWVMFLTPPKSMATSPAWRRVGHWGNRNTPCSLYPTPVTALKPDFHTGKN